jgi:hypothetical protein
MISYSTAWRTAMAAMADMALMPVMAAVLSSMAIRDYSNRTICRQDPFRSSMDSSFAGVWVSILSTPSEELGSTPLEVFGSASASSG